MAKKLSRGPQINLETCIANAGGNRYDLTVNAARRAREINKTLGYTADGSYLSPTVTALLEIEANVSQQLGYSKQ